MLHFPLFFVLVGVSSGTFTASMLDLNCTDGEKYLPSAVGCLDIGGDECSYRFDPGADQAPPTAGGDVDRPQKCWADSTGNFSQVAKDLALKNCANYCGFCCQIPAYNCADPIYKPGMLNCSEITPTDCSNTTFQPTLAKYCPFTCGLCDVGTCRDYFDCASHPSICTDTDAEIVQFANNNCKRYCGLCDSPSGPDGVTTSSRKPVATTSSTNPAARVTTTACVDLNPKFELDSFFNKNFSCNQWAANGFCTLPFYTNTNDPETYCKKTCGMCKDSSASCVDNSSDCVTWKKNGFCQNTSLQNQKTYCAKTCGVC